MRLFIAALLALSLAACSGSKERAAKLDWLTAQALDYVQGTRAGSGTVASVLPEQVAEMRRCSEPKAREVIAAMTDGELKQLTDHLTYLTRPRISGPADMREVLREAEKYSMSEAGREGQQLTAQIERAIAPCGPDGAASAMPAAPGFR